MADSLALAVVVVVVGTRSACKCGAGVIWQLVHIRHRCGDVSTYNLSDGRESESCFFLSYLPPRNTYTYVVVNSIYVVEGGSRYTIEKRQVWCGERCTTTTSVHLSAARVVQTILFCIICSFRSSSSSSSNGWSSPPLSSSFQPWRPKVLS